MRNPCACLPCRPQGRMNGGTPVWWVVPPAVWQCNEGVHCPHAAWQCTEGLHCPASPLRCGQCGSATEEAKMTAPVQYGSVPRDCSAPCPPAVWRFTEGEGGPRVRGVGRGGRTGSTATKPPTTVRKGGGGGWGAVKLSEYAAWYFRVYVRVHVLRRESFARGWLSTPLGWG